MLHFSKATIIRNSAGTFSVVGKVPANCLRYNLPPTRDQIMSGRLVEVEGVTYGWQGKAFSSAEEAKAAIIEGGGSL